MADNKKSDDKKQEKTPQKIAQWKIKFTELVEFLTYDIWRVDSGALKKNQSFFYNVIKTIILTVRRIGEQDLGAKAASLTYRTVLSIVPLLAVLFAIGRGFGFENILQSEIFSYFGVSKQPSLSSSGGDGSLTHQVIRLINNSLEYAKGSGLFAGIGIALLLYTVYILFNDIEKNFNIIWTIKKGRSVQRQATDYFALMLLLPILILLNYGMSLLLSSFTKYLYILYPATQFLNILPFVLIVLALTALYKFMPNTRVKFINALIAGLVAGTAYQLFQNLYMNGQIWITQYNAIYGTFAAIPLMLLWLQLSWYIILIGVELAYSSQNVHTFSFERETQTISRRFRDFFTVLILSEIVKRFANEQSPYTRDELSRACRVPIALTSQILDDLHEMQIVSIINSGDVAKEAYQPALDINLISMGYLESKIDQFGSEDFKIDTQGAYYQHWKAFMRSRECLYNKDNDTLLKDL